MVCNSKFDCIIFISLAFVTFILIRTKVQFAFYQLFESLSVTQYILFVRVSWVTGKRKLSLLTGDDCIYSHPIHIRRVHWNADKHMFKRWIWTTHNKRTKYKYKFVKWRSTTTTTKRTHFSFPSTFQWFLSICKCHSNHFKMHTFGRAILRMKRKTKIHLINTCKSGWNRTANVSYCNHVHVCAHSWDNAMDNNGNDDDVGEKSNVKWTNKRTK